MPGGFSSGFGSGFGPLGFEETGVVTLAASPAITDSLDLLSGPHVARIWMLEIDLPDNHQWFHNGVGRISVNGHVWLGVTDPVSGQVVSIQSVEEPRFGQAPSVLITIASPSLEFYRSVKSLAREIEGVDADLWWAAFDPETEQLAAGPFKMFRGKASSPTIHRNSEGLRTVSITVESIWQSQNFQFGGRWSPTGQRMRYPGDEGFDFVGVKVVEQWK